MLTLSPYTRSQKLDPATGKLIGRQLRDFEKAKLGACIGSDGCKCDVKRTPNCGMDQVPIFKSIDLDHVIVDELHLGLRITDRLLRVRNICAVLHWSLVRHVLMLRLFIARLCCTGALRWMGRSNPCL